MVLLPTTIQEEVKAKRTASFTWIYRSKWPSLSSFSFCFLHSFTVCCWKRGTMQTVTTYLVSGYNSIQMTGNEEGSHLSFEIRVLGKDVYAKDWSSRTSNVMSLDAKKERQRVVCQSSGTKHGNELSLSLDSRHFFLFDRIHSKAITRRAN